MGDKVRGAIAIAVGLFAIWQGYVYYQKSGVDWHLWFEAVAGVLLIAIGIWRFRRKPVDLTSELLK